MDWSKVLDALRLSPKHLVAISLVSGVLLLSPSQFVTRLGLDSFVSSYKVWISLVFFASSALLVSELLEKVWLKGKQKYEQKKFLTSAQERLKHLTLEEKLILANYIYNQTKTQYFEMENGVINGLNQAGIVYLASSMGNAFVGFAFNIQPWAWKYLNANKELLKFTPEEEQKFNYLRSIGSLP